MVSWLVDWLVGCWLVGWLIVRLIGWLDCIWLLWRNYYTHNRNPVRLSPFAQHSHTTTEPLTSHHITSHHIRSHHITSDHITIHLTVNHESKLQLTPSVVIFRYQVTYCHYILGLIMSSQIYFEIIFFRLWSRVKYFFFQKSPGQV